MNEPKPKQHNIKVRRPGKKTSTGIFDNLRSLPHPVEELLGLPNPPNPESQIDQLSSSYQQLKPSEQITRPNPTQPIPIQSDPTHPSLTYPNPTQPNPAQSKTYDEQSYEQDITGPKENTIHATDTSYDNYTQPIPTYPNPSQVYPEQPNLSQPIPTQYGRQPGWNPAPTRDFNRRANSLEREALPSGLFPGTSKKLYDALYLRTRGAIKPKHTIKAKKRELMQWSGIKSKNTIAVNLQILRSNGLVIPYLQIGDHEGSIYEVRLPEEIGWRGKYDPSQPTPTYPNSPQPIPTQNLGGDPTQKMGWDGLGYSEENKEDIVGAKTPINTIDDETHTQNQLMDILKDVVRDVLCVTDVSFQREKERWVEFLKVLAEELRSAGQRTSSISSAPAFFSEHLRRRFARSQENLHTKNTSDNPKAVQRPKPQVQQTTTIPTTGESKFTIEQCRAFAEHLKGNGRLIGGRPIENTGGLAATFHSTGTADADIEIFLGLKPEAVKIDSSQCPDCGGRGLRYKDESDPSLGMIKCKHETLRASMDTQPSDAQEEES